MAPTKKSASRAEAGVVEEDFTPQPQDEAIAAGEAIPEETLEGGEAVTTPPSMTRVSGMSEEEQSMEMTPTVVGPPGYGSPDPISSAGRLLPLDQHPFNPQNLPDDHPAAIDQSYGEGYGGTIAPEDIGQSFPGTSSGSDLENDRLGAGESEEDGGDYNEQTKTDLLAEAESRGLDVNSSNTKAEIVTALEEDDATS